MPGKGIHEFNVITKAKQKITVYKNNSYNGGAFNNATSTLADVANLQGGSATSVGWGFVIQCNTLGEWSFEVDKVERGDKTNRSSGRRNAFDFDLELSMSDFEQVKYMHQWAQDAIDASRYTVGDDYAGVNKDAYRAVQREYLPHIKEDSDVAKATAIDVWVTSEKLPDYALDSTDEAVATYSLTASDVFFNETAGNVFAG